MSVPHRSLFKDWAERVLMLVVFCGICAHPLSAAEDESLNVSFVDVAEISGLILPNVWGGVTEKKYIIEAKGSGLGFIDFDNDGWLDIFETNGVRFGEEYFDESAPRAHLYHSGRDGSFTEVGRQAGIARTGWLTGVCVGDYDNDGWEDIFSADWGFNALYRNKGNGTFSDVSREVGLYGKRKRWASGCAWVDYDLDGNLDLFVANYIELDLEKVPSPGEQASCIWRGIPVLCGPRGLPGGRNLLYHNKGNGQFEDVSGKAGIDAAGPAYAITAVAADFNNDRWPDIYVAVDSQPSLLFVNQGDGTFTEEGMIAGCAFSENGSEQAGMGVGVADFNADGWLDIFKTNFQYDTCNLYQNNGDGTFRDVAILAGLGVNTQYVNWGAGFIDFDNDGWVDIFHVTGHVYPEGESSPLQTPMESPRLVYRNLGTGRFEDVSDVLGSGVSQRFASRGSAYGDYDNDGDVDVVVLNMNDRPSLLRCDSNTGNHWLLLKLVGTKANRSAIGTRVRIKTGKHWQTGEVQSGGSVMSQNDLRLHFGLGKAETVDRIEVSWPTTGAVEVFESVGGDRILTIKEGEGIVVPKSED